MNIYKVWQEVNYNYCQYTEAIIVAENEAEAIDISMKEFSGSWVDSKDVKVSKLGTADKNISKGVVLFEYNEG